MKTKKIISLFLSIVMLVSAIVGVDLTSYASYDNIYQAYNYIFGETYYGYTSESNPRDYLRFVVSYPGTITIEFTGDLKDRRGTPFESIARGAIGICDKNGNDILFTEAYYNSNRGYDYLNYSMNLVKGEYYFYTKSDFYYYVPSGNYSVNITYKPNISTPSSLKVSTRNTTSLKLSWSKVGGVSGYQLQRKSGDSYKTLVNTTSTSYTAKKLKAGTTYSFRVRAYKTIDGKKYYSAWKTLKTPTKPSRPSIKTPSTNKKHQIIAKWGKVTNCSGYQVQYSKKRSFSSVIATRTVSGSSKTSYTGKNFTKGKTYYVRVRSYKTVDGKKYYSSWSSVKSIKCK